ncbi:hypothetical protein PVT68_17265 [Microbulbifer bruguierae]|uniref:Cycloisomerase n=1 Tax=Microbulbifer bruguierae TaxID=3029061 RepID=A0ABY8NC52_9GAMM|nr:hypothetical protein [Microbulbifer bruguierae]WGL16499.1 hypothetical protein PVT68_17265 [Microbulbifer bruguierae]
MFDTFDARQGVAVDRNHFYAINNFRITKHDKTSGEAILQWDGISDAGPLVHLDSGVVWNGKLYAAHSNYPAWPMASSVEIWDTNTLEHVGSHSFGIDLGSFTWLDRWQGFWWGGFGNYDKVQRGQDHPYGQTINTQVVKMDDDFRVLQRWTLPASILERIAPMSNSGGSWGADGYLYLTGHDHPEIYVVQLPEQGAALQWVSTVLAPEIHGQGLAWDRSGPANTLWGIRKRDRKVFRMQMPEILPGSPLTRIGRLDGVLREGGNFNRE